MIWVIVWRKGWAAYDVGHAYACACAAVALTVCRQGDGCLGQVAQVADLRLDLLHGIRSRFGLAVLRLRGCVGIGSLR